MDIKDMFAPTSDQMDATDLSDAPRTLTVNDVTPGPSDKQPLNVHFAEFARPWRPNKGTGRFLKAHWGTDTTLWPGRRITLYNDPEVWYGKEKTGGIRISHMSHIDKPVTMPNLERGKHILRTVQPLTDAPRVEPVRISDTLPGPSADDIAACTDQDQLREWWSTVASPDDQKLIEARAAELKADAAAEDPPATGLAAAKAALHGEQGELA